MGEPSRFIPWPKTSHWSEIAAACRPDSAESGRAIESLCENFRVPVQSYLRREGCDHDEAQDLAQEFFLFLLGDSRPLENYDRSRSRFRTFLLAVLKNFLKSRRRHEMAQKRGGGRHIGSIHDAEGDALGLADSGPSPEVE